MTQGIDLVNEIRRQLESKIQDEMVKRDRNREEMSRNYMLFFQWQAKELYKTEYLLGNYNDFLRFLDTDPDGIEILKYLQRCITMLTEGLLRGRLHENNSNPMQNLAYSLEMECKQEILQNYSSYFVFLDNEGA